MTVSQNKQHLSVSGAGSRIIGWVITILFIIAMALCFFYVSYYSNHDREYVRHGAAIRVLSQKIAKNANGTFASNNNPDHFDLLDKSSRSLRAHLMALQDPTRLAGDNAKFDLLYGEMTQSEGVSGSVITKESYRSLIRSLPPAEAAGKKVAEILPQVVLSWDGMNKDINRILSKRDSVIDIKENADDIRVGMPSIQQRSQELAERMIRIGSSSRHVHQATMMNYYSEQILKNIGDMLSIQSSKVEASSRLEKSREDFIKAITSLRDGNQNLGITKIYDAKAIEILDNIWKDYGVLDRMLLNMLPAEEGSKEKNSNNKDFSDVRDAANRISKASNELLARCNRLVMVFENLKNERVIKEWYGMVFGALSLLMVVLMGVLSRREARVRIEEAVKQKQITDEETERNQQAILELLDEMQGLSEGDLTSHASVGEAFTGAIADAFNSAIDALRKLVMTINDTSVQISSAAEQTQQTAMHLAEASDHQAHQITGASAAINEMAVSIDQVSKNAEESTLVAQKSVDLSVKGAETVRKTINGMDSIREQIQETSKRIKRLGESSQEIGNIVELINDIADQTNILALNASIQAAMAGEAGRGFAVVADEVQRLAERSGNATKQIEALVKTIQTDTNEAVISMEQSTAGVVAGAKQAESSGDALREIESVSTHLANLIQNISQAARQQANAAAQISDTMNVIQEITSQTSAGTNETATSIGNLADLANDLRESVAGFKLPE